MDKLHHIADLLNNKPKTISLHQRVLMDCLHFQFNITWIKTNMKIHYSDENAKYLAI